MRIIIFTEGGKTIGFGHISRCIALYQAFEEKGIIPELIINGDESIKEVVSGIKNYTYDWLNLKEKTISKIRNSDIVIIDSYKAPRNFYTQTAETVKLSVFIDDNYRIDYPNGIIINGNIYADRKKYSNERAKYLLGPKYIMLRKEFWVVPEKKINKCIKSVMLTFGGEDSKNMTLNILSKITNDYPDFDIKVVIGINYKHIKQIEGLKNYKITLIYYPDAGTIKRIMLEADIGISAGGQTISELARIGVPTVAILTADNQMNNVNGWLKAGFTEYAGCWKDDNLLIETNNSIKNLVDVNLRKKRQLTGRNLVDGQGSLRVVERLLHEYESAFSN